MQCDCMPPWHPQGPISEWPQHFHDILHNGAFILSCEEWPVISEFWIFKPLTCGFVYSEGALEQLQGQVPTGLHMHNRKYPNVDFGLLIVNELFSITRCLCNQYSKHSLLYEGQFQHFQNTLKYVLSQISWLNLVSWPTPYRFLHCPLFEAFDCSQCLRFHSLQIGDQAHGLPKTWCRLWHWDCSWMHIKPAIWRAPCKVCGYSMQATRFQRPQGLIAARLSSSNLRWHDQS